MSSQLTLLQPHLDLPPPHTSRFEIESLLSSRTTSSQSGFWGSDNGDDSMQESISPYSVPGSSSALPRALERIFSWLQDVEAPHDVSTT